MLFYVTCIRFEFVKSPEVSLCGWRGYNHSIKEQKHLNVSIPVMYLSLRVTSPCTSTVVTNLHWCKLTFFHSRCTNCGREMLVYQIRNNCVKLHSFSQLFTSHAGAVWFLTRLLDPLALFVPLCYVSCVSEFLLRQLQPTPTVSHCIRH